ncbi:MAG: hypothetical protein A3G49_04190 [Candidatus Sungbacteria bacterium RIFCSPLOWO2_12_FULL_41_11]|uniref:Plasmid stabilization protein n=1 Tax=Candidatus Sungbacteria bacterium RIFCSPLOWO2_12_FULL_41_11 TaxID=1802286 RepID=A0A1G2LT98_9BACT|nr:MAG: hypothetical protein A3D41_02655 [Candidatus Sungbacteria bacterium RIFCSPHIGHO2_02_FULL_41_12b]OHA14860.1 MAG: hypothetical protein A3G49_04190 [Candidatus Sungbacteria bacterium RIFCSPLOWO2_12_FULL_41_11]
MAKINLSHTSPYFERQFDKLPGHLKKIATRKILLFENNPFHPSLNTHKLKGALSLYWAFYITKAYRVMLRFLDNNEVIYYDIDTHDIYE